jgi:hypothetical protein
MRQPQSRSTVPATTPSLVEVQQDLTILTGLPLPIVVDLRRQISHLAADVDAVLYRILSEARTKDQRSDAEPDRLLTPLAAAAVAPRPRRRDPRSPAAIPQDRAVQRAPPRAVLGANTGLTTRQLVPMLPPPAEAVERSVRMRRPWWMSHLPNAWAPSSGLVTMTGDDEGPGAAHPQGRYP